MRCSTCCCRCASVRRCDFDLVAVNLDQKQPGFPAHVLPQYLRSRGVPFHIEDQDTYSIVKKLIPEGQTMCSLCSRLRRGILYRVASELGATKIALGHHRDDMVVTLLMNMFFGGRLKGMPPKLASDDGRHVVIRPLAYVAETDLERWAAHRQFPIIPCTLCGSQDSLQRVQIKAMVREWERQYPGRTDNMLHAMGHVVPSHLMDRRLYPFTTLKASGVADAGGDKAFDDDDDGCASAGGRSADPPRRSAEATAPRRCAARAFCAASARRSSSQPLSLPRAVCRCAGVVLLCSCAMKPQLYSVSRCW